MEKEQLIRLQMIEQEANHLNQQFQLIEQNASQMKELKESLYEIKNGKNKEILVDIGKRIFLPVRISDDRLIVDVGNKNLIKKSASETGKLIEEQIRRLVITKTEIMEKLRDLESEMEKIIKSINEKAEKEHRH